MTRLFVVAAGLALAPSLALAQTAQGPVIATAAAPPQPAPPTPEVSTLAPSAIQPIDRSQSQDRRVHGSASVAVGTHGYRAGEIHVDGPIGATGYGSITIGGAQDAPWRR